MREILIKYMRLTKFRLGTGSLSLFFTFLSSMKPSLSINDLLDNLEAVNRF
jgi:hypothetical protein